jgi:hypothetical protein
MKPWKPQAEREKRPSKIAVDSVPRLTAAAAVAKEGLTLLLENRYALFVFRTLFWQTL